MNVHVRHVEFPCGRLGLEVEETYYGGSETQMVFRYFYNGTDYVKLAKAEVSKPSRGFVELKFNYWGRIEGLKVLRETVNLNHVICEASSNWM